MSRICKYLSFGSVAVLILYMAAMTVLEKFLGTEAAMKWGYHSAEGKSPAFIKSLTKHTFISTALGNRVFYAIYRETRFEIATRWRMTSILKIQFLSSVNIMGSWDDNTIVID